MSAWWLFLIVPVAGSLGALAMALFASGGNADSFEAGMRAGIARSKATVASEAKPPRELYDFETGI